MTTLSDLRDAYAHLSDLAPTRGVRDVPRPAGPRRPGRTRGRLRLVLAAAMVLLLAVLSPVLVHRLSHDGRFTPAGPTTTPTTATFPTAYLFGPSSLAGYDLTTESLDPHAQTFGFTNVKTHARVSLSALPATAANDGIYHRGDPVTVSGRPGFFNVVDGDLKTPTVAWKLSANRWVTVSGTKTGSQKSQTKAELVAIARSVRAARDDHAALVVVGHLPDHMKFDSVAVYRNQGTMAAPDLYTGTGYRSETFVDPRPGNASSFDIVSVYHPFQSLATATPETLPAFDNGPWTKTTVHGHLAWTAPHDVLIQWGPILIDLTSNRPTGNTSIPLVSRKDLLDVAASLTVPSSNAVGAGFPLGTSLPNGTLE